MQLPAIIYKPSGQYQIVEYPVSVTYGEGEQAILHPADVWALWTPTHWRIMCPDWRIYPLTENPAADAGMKAVKKPVEDWIIHETYVEVTYDQVALTAAEIEAAKPPVPRSVTNFQARAALLAAGLFDQVNGALMAMPVNSTARQAWEYANEVTRTGSLVNSLAEQLGLTSAQMDDLFRQAATIEA